MTWNGNPRSGRAGHRIVARALPTTQSERSPDLRVEFLRSLGQRRDLIVGDFPEYPRRAAHYFRPADASIVQFPSLQNGVQLMDGARLLDIVPQW